MTMAWTWQDLVLFSGAVYGLAWLVTRSKLFARARQFLNPASFFGQLLSCIVCTGTWVAVSLFLLAPWCGLFSDGFYCRNPVDLMVVMGWSISILWTVGRITGDAA